MSSDLCVSLQEAEATIMILKKSLISMKNITSDQQETIKYLTGTLSGAKSEYAKVLEKVSVLESELAEVQSQPIQAIKDKEEIEKELELVYQEKIGDLQKRVKSQMELNKQLSSDLERYKLMEITNSNRSNQQSKEGKLTIKNQEELEIQLKMKEAELAQCKSRCNQLSSREAEVSEIKQKLIDTQVSLRNFMREVETLKAEIVTSEERCLGLETENDRLERFLKSKQEEIHAKETKLQSLQCQCTSLEKQFELEQKLMLNKISEAQQKCEQAQQTVHLMELEKAKFSADMEKLQFELSYVKTDTGNSLIRASSSMEDITKQNDCLKEQLKLKEMELVRITEHLATETALKQDLQDKLFEFEIVKKELLLVQGKFRELQTKFTDSQSDSLKHNNELIFERARNTEMTLQLSQLKSEHQLALNTITLEVKELQQAKEKLQSKYKDKISKIQLSLTELSEKLTSSEKQKKMIEQVALENKRKFEQKLLEFQRMKLVNDLLGDSEDARNNSSN
jgi:hypothetical protein